MTGLLHGLVFSGFLGGWREGAALTSCCILAHADRDDGGTAGGGVVVDVGQGQLQRVGGPVTCSVSHRHSQLIKHRYGTGSVPVQLLRHYDVTSGAVDAEIRRLRPW